MKLVIAGTGASGAIYLQRLLAQIDCAAKRASFVLSPFAKQVIHEELGELQVPAGVHEHNDRSMNVPFASGRPILMPWSSFRAPWGRLGV